MVVGMRSRTSGSAGLRWKNDWPKSPRAMFPPKRTNCTAKGSLKPMFWRSTARSASGASGIINAALPLVTVAGLQFGLLLGGAIVTETVFAVPGLGRLVVGAIRQLDFPIVQAGVFVLALIVVLVNFAVDMLYVYLNPQIRVR